jgi:exopolyphosphatase/guanosine-5'-triphosphate,3'-diphosphate pyrophosphatase
LRVAAVDIGTNSVLLLVAEVNGDEVVAVIEHAEITRLGKGVDASRRLAPDAVERTLACLRRYGAEIRAAGAVAVDAVGTSAMRDAQGGAELALAAGQALGVAPRVISGEEEAELTYRGALSGLAVEHAQAAVFDVGGGSTEVIWPTDSGLQRTSLDIGSVRLTERHIRSDPPAATELEAARQDARSALAGLARPPKGPLVGVAGTVTTLAAVLHELKPYDGARVHGAPVTIHAVARLRNRLAAMPLEERKEVPGLDPARADVIVSGAVIVHEVLDWAGADRLIASDRGVRWGLALQLARGGARMSAR